MKYKEIFEDNDHYANMPHGILRAKTMQILHDSGVFNEVSHDEDELYGDVSGKHKDYEDMHSSLTSYGWKKSKTTSGSFGSEKTILNHPTGMKLVTTKQKMLNGRAAYSARLHSAK